MEESEWQEIVSELKAIIRHRQPQMATNYLQVREIYKAPYDLPELDALRSEVALCLVFGLYQAAMTLTNHFLEALLKYALIYDYALKRQSPHDQEQGKASGTLVKWLAEGASKYGGKELSSTIDGACSAGLITKEQKKRLHEIRRDFRNAYSHADKGKLFKGATTQVSTLEVGQEGVKADPPEEVLLEQFVLGQGIFQVKHAELNAAPYFQYVDGVARDIWARLFPTENSRAGA